MGPLAGILSGIDSSTASSVEASTTRYPVVAPAGTVLRVRLNQTLEIGRSRPGDRFSGTLDAPIVVGNQEVLPKDTLLQGHIETAEQGHDALALTLDSYELDGQKFALQTNTVTRTGNSRRIEVGLVKTRNEHVTVPAESIIGFTLTCTLAI